MTAAQAREKANGVVNGGILCKTQYDMIKNIVLSAAEEGCFTVDYCTWPYNDRKPLIGDVRKMLIKEGYQLKDIQLGLEIVTKISW